VNKKSYHFSLVLSK